MKRGRLSFFIFLLILGLPVAALNFGGANVSSLITDRLTEFVPEPSVVSAAEPEDIAPDPFEWLNARPALREVFIPNEMTDARYITVQEIVRPEDLLRPGEAVPDEEFMALYAAARAPARLIRYCEEVVATIALQCDVARAQTRLNREGNWQLDGRLAFVPATELGDPSIVADGRLLNTRVSLPYTGDLRPPNDAQTRAAMLTQAQEVCETLRARIGNCVLTRVIFEVQELWITDLEALPAGTNPQRIDAVAEYTVYADPLELDSTSFAELVGALVNPS